MEIKNKTKDFRTRCNEEMGYISGIFMSQGDTRAGDIIMPTEELIETTDRLCLYLFVEVAKAKQEERDKLIMEERRCCDENNVLLKERIWGYNQAVKEINDRINKKN